MPSSYTTSLRLTLPATGELTGTWGTTVNTGITELLDSAVAGTTTISTWGGAGVAYTLSNTDGAADEARRMFIVATGAPGEAKNVICPAVSKLYFFRNDTTGGFALTLKTSGGSGIAVPAGQYKVLYCNGTNVVEAFNSLASLTLGTALAASSGGTGQSTYTTGDLLYSTGATALSKLGIGTNGQILTSTGTAPQWSTLSGVAVTTFSAGTTGFTPSTATAGAVTLAGTLATTNGGTGLTSFTSGGVVYASSSSALTTGSALTFAANVLTSPNVYIAGVGNSLSFDTTSGAAANYIQTVNSFDMRLYCGRGSTSYIDVGTDGQRFGIGASEQMRLTSTGLGIGTSSPSYKLDVQGGSARADAFVGPNNLTSYMNLAQSNGLVVRGAAGSPANQVELWTLGSVKATLDSSGNLGLGVTPSAWGTTDSIRALQLSGGAFYVFGGNRTYHGQNVFVATGGIETYVTTAAASTYRQFQGAHSWYNAPSGTAGNAISFTQAMTLTSGGDLLVGTTTANLTAAGRGLIVANGSSSSILSLENAGTTAFYLFANGDNTDVWNSRNGYLRFATNNTERMRLDSSGNLGLGVTPSAWGSSYKALQITTGSSLWATTSGGAYYSSNVYFDGTNRRYVYTGNATEYEQSVGAHKWYTAPSGTAGNAISFTQAMTLDASGRLLLGTTTPEGMLTVVAPASTGYGSLDAANSGFANLTFKTGGTVYAYIGSANAFVTGGTANDFAIRSQNSLTFATGGGTERARITSGGDLLVGATSLFDVERCSIVAPSGSFRAIYAKNDNNGVATQITHNAATSGDNIFVTFGTEATFTARGSIDYNRAGGLTRYNTTSDYRAKDIIGPVQNPGATIDALKVYEGVMKGATQSRPMLVAHEAQAVAPYAVSGVKDEVNEDGSPKFQQIDVSSLVPLLLAEIQSLRQRLAAAGI